MKTSRAVLLLLAAIGAIQAVQRERHQRQHNHVAVTQLHHNRLAHLTANPDLAQQWAPEEMDVKEYVQLLDVNQQIVALSLRHRLGLTRGNRLRIMADAVMEREAVRRYGKYFGGFRTQEAAGDRLARRFTAIMHDAYVARPEPDPVRV
ncbi:DUF6082 family protein [Streptomyces sp. NPDC057555]|uniref:DUF6082 family protein n=1 Tax=Streptomyces sp. NPDC057555 TaxID=3346166 RepID=UPI0036C63407